MRHGKVTDHSCCAGNVLLTSCAARPHGFRAKISDFGLARNLSIQSKIETRTYGTITHMPLELLCDGIMSKVRSCQNWHSAGDCLRLTARSGAPKDEALSAWLLQ